MSDRPRKPAELIEFEKTFTQDADTCDGNGPLQFLRVQQEDGGSGPFWLIVTERWAIESIAELVAVLEQAGVPR